MGKTIRICAYAWLCKRLSESVHDMSRSCLGIEAFDVAAFLLIVRLCCAFLPLLAGQVASAHACWCMALRLLEHACVA
jgi:hypothetical protein